MGGRGGPPSAARRKSLSVRNRRAAQAPHGDSAHLKHFNELCCQTELILKGNKVAEEALDIAAVADLSNKHVVRIRTALKRLFKSTNGTT